VHTHQGLRAGVDVISDAGFGGPKNPAEVHLHVVLSPCCCADDFSSHLLHTAPGSERQQMTRTCCQIGQNWQNEKLWQRQMVEVRLDVVGSGYSSQPQPSQLASTSTAYGYEALSLSS